MTRATVLYLVLAFPLIAAIGWGAARPVLRQLYGVRAYDILMRRSGWIHSLFLGVPVVAVLVWGRAEGTLAAMGLQAPQAGLVPLWTAWLVTVAAPIVAAGLYLFELFFSSRVRQWLRARGRPAALSSIVQGQSTAFGALPAPAFADFMGASAASSAAEELIWRGFLLVALPAQLGWAPATALAAAGLVFGVTHAYFGVRNVFLKTVHGIVWGAMFIATGSLLAPFLSHLAFQYLVWRRLVRRRSGPPEAAPRAAALQGGGAVA